MVAYGELKLDHYAPFCAICTGLNYFYAPGNFFFQGNEVFRAGNRDIKANPIAAVPLEAGNVACIDGRCFSAAIDARWVDQPGPGHKKVLYFANDHFTFEPISPAF